MTSERPPAAIIFATMAIVGAVGLIVSLPKLPRFDAQLVTVMFSALVVIGIVALVLKRGV